MYELGKKTRLCRVYKILLGGERLFASTISSFNCEIIYKTTFVLPLSFLVIALIWCIFVKVLLLLKYRYFIKIKIIYLFRYFIKIIYLFHYFIKIIYLFRYFIKIIYLFRYFIKIKIIFFISLFY